MSKNFAKRIAMVAFSAVKEDIMCLGIPPSLAVKEQRDEGMEDLRKYVNQTYNVSVTRSEAVREFQILCKENSDVFFAESL